MNDSNKNTKAVIDIIIRIGVLFILIAWCFQILSPFLNPVLWAILIAVALFPAYNALSNRLNGKRKLSAIIVTLVLLSLIIIPSLLFFGSLVEGAKTIGEQMVNEEFKIPPPTENVKDWPVIGGKMYESWLLASQNLDQLIGQYSQEIASFGSSLLGAVVGTGLGLLQFILSIIIAGVLLAKSEGSGRFATTFFTKIVGERGAEFADICKITIKNVAKGILGVSIIQSTLAGIGFMLAGVPYAGLWALLSLILAVVQLGPGLVIIPVIIYMFATGSALSASLWTVYFILVMFSDNLLKPILLGKGAPVPMLVIFLGSIGGFITTGFVGLFVGAIVLSLGYKLFMAWVMETEEVSVEG